MAKDQRGSWLCKLDANYNSKSKRTGRRNTVNEKNYNLKIQKKLNIVAKKLFLRNNSLIDVLMGSHAFF